MPKKRSYLTPLEPKKTPLKLDIPEPLKARLDAITEQVEQQIEGQRLDIEAIVAEHIETVLDEVEAQLKQLKATTEAVS